MKKFLSLLLALIMTFTSFAAFAAPSPTTASLTKAPYAITCQMAEFDEAIDLWTEVMLDENIMSELITIFSNADFQLDEMYYINITKPFYETTWYLPRVYTEQDKVVTILYGESIYIITGHPQDNKVIFDFTDVAIGEYAMMIIANPVAET